MKQIVVLFQWLLTELEFLGRFSMCLIELLLLYLLQAGLIDAAGDVILAGDVIV